VSYPDQWLLIATRQLSKGVHRIELRRGGVSLHPASGNGVDGLNRTLGPLVIIPARAVTPAVHRARLDALARMCRSTQRLRWLEVVRPA
jgi:hypothetical protein